MHTHLGAKKPPSKGMFIDGEVRFDIMLLYPWPEFTPILVDFSVEMPPRNMMKRPKGPKTCLKQTAYAIRKLQKNFNITSLLAKAGNDCTLSYLYNIHSCCIRFICAVSIIYIYIPIYLFF